MIPRRGAASSIVMAAIVIVAVTALAAVAYAFLSYQSAASSTTGVSVGPGSDSGDIVDGSITVNASQHSFYQFDVPYGAQGISVHAQWSSSGAIKVYVMNATDLIGWQSGHGLRAFYKSGQSSQGDVNMRVPPDDLYYLVFDNTLAPSATDVQVTSGVSYLCNLCSINEPIQQLSSSSASCAAVNGSEVCSVALSNRGTEATSPTGTCIESWSLDEGPGLSWGAPHLGVFTPSTPISPSSSLSGSCTVAGSSVPLGLAITVQIPFTDGVNLDLYGPAGVHTVVATLTVTETLTTQASQPTTTYASPTTNCTSPTTITVTTTIIAGPQLPESTTTTTTTVTTTSTSYSQTVTVTSCTYSVSTVTSAVTTIVTR